MSLAKQKTLNQEKKILNITRNNDVLKLYSFLELKDSLNNCSLKKLANLEPSHLKFDGNSIYIGEYSSYASPLVFIKKSKLLCYLLQTHNIEKIKNKTSFYKKFETNYLPGILIPKFKKFPQHKTCFLINADTTATLIGTKLSNKNSRNIDNPIQDSGFFDEYPGCSFNCLSRFYGSNFDNVIDKINEKKLILIDYTLNERIYYTEAQLHKKLKDNIAFSSKPPQLGFTAMSNSWHRSGSVLFYDIETNTSIILGQDEEFYFGSEIKGKVKSVTDAFEKLAPKEIKDKKYLRQGEWFLVGINSKDLPLQKDVVLNFGSRNHSAQNVYLPLEHKNSNKHSITSISSGMVDNKGRLFFKDIELSHEEHCSVSFKGWCTVYKNNAIRSFSEEGVD